MKIVAISIAVAGGLWAQAQVFREPLLEEGRKLVAELKLDQKQDERLFDALGQERAAALLNAVMSDGQRRDATLEDWKALHRATAGLIELHVQRGELFKAALFASFQETFFRNFEHDYEQALAAARSALELQERSGVKETLYLQHLGVGRELFSLGRIEEAAAEFRRARDLCTQPQRPVAANIWGQIVEADIAAGKLASAAEEARRFGEVARSTGPLFRAKATLAEAQVEMARGRYGEAVDMAKAARAIVAGTTEKESIDLEVLALLMSCVLDAMHTVSYDEALALAKRMDQELPGMLFQVGPFARRAVQFRRRLAGDIEGVLRDDTEALQNSRRAGNVRGQIEAMRSLAVSYAALHAVGQQIELLEEALALEETLLPADGSPDGYAAAYSYFRTLGSLGDAYLVNRETGKARRTYERMTKGLNAIQKAGMRQQLQEFFGEAALSRASVAELDDDPDAAREILEGELKARPKDSGVLLQYARLERNLNEKPQRTAELYEGALEVLGSARNRPAEIAARLEYAHYLATGGVAKIPEALGKAASQIAAADAQAKTADFADAQWRARYVTGLIAEARNDRDGAIAQYRLAVAKLEQIRAGLTQQEQRRSFTDTEAAQDLYQHLIALLIATNRPDQAWDYIERAKARTFVELLQGRRFQAPAGEAPKTAKLRDLEQKMADLRVQLTPENEALLRGAGRDPGLIENKLRALESEFALEREQEGLSATREGNVLALHPAGLEKIQKLLPAHGALLEYSLLGDSIGAWVVTRTTSKVLVWPLKAADLRRRVSSLRGFLSHPNATEGLNEAIAAASKMILEPVLAAIPVDVDRLLIVPAGPVSYLPFQALVLPDGRHMVDRFAISYLPSASTLEFLRDEGSLGGTLFLGALGGVGVEGMSPLPGTLRETDAIARIEPKVRRESEGRFTHDRALAALTGTDRVHFATHGLVDDRAPLFSALLTAPAPGQPSRLSLYEITSTPVRARLVVLSACETGLGKLLGGDEITGLTRTLLTAGASTVVSSLWKVSDESTALLMEEFYRGLRAGKEPAYAMRDAALMVRKQYPHPFFWTPFIVTGAR